MFYSGESDTELRLNCLRLIQSLILDDGNFGVVHKLKEVVSNMISRGVARGFIMLKPTK